MLVASENFFLDSRVYVDLNEFPRALEREITSIHPDMPTIKFSQEEARAVRAYLWAIQQ